LRSISIIAHTQLNFEAKVFDFGTIAKYLLDLIKGKLQMVSTCPRNRAGGWFDFG